MAQLLRNEVPEKLTWDLSTIFASDEQWETAFSEIQQDLKGLKQFEGHVGDSATTLQNALEADLKLERQLEKVYVYAHQIYDQDTTNQTYAAFNTRVQGLWAEVSEATAYFQPEVLNIPDDSLTRFLKTPELQPYTHLFETLQAQKPHTLPADQEGLLAGVSDILGASENTFGVLDNSDITFADVHTEDGEIVPLTNGLYSLLLESQSRDLRREAFETLYDSYIRLQNTFASTLSSHVKGHNFLAKVRHYDSAREAAILPHSLPTSVFDTLRQTVDENLPLLHRFVALRRKVLGVEDVHSYDLYVPLVDEVEFDVTYDRAQEIVLAALAPLGQDYLEIVQKAFDERWIDVVENKGKRSGAYSSGTYDTNPFILLNWQNNLNNVYTLAHEMGHSVHSYMTRHQQPYHYGDYPIFLAEIASTTNESLLTDYLLKTNDDSKFQAYVLNQYLDGFKGTVFRQTQFAEFEDWIHEQSAAGEALTADKMSAYYAALNQRYYGPDLFPDEEIAYEWTRIPHFYYNYYVYQYATGEAAATTLAERIINHDGAEAYKTYLKAGSSDYPLNVISRAGVDMNQAGYLKQAFSVFESRLDQLENLLIK
ncbi:MULTISPECIES: oligoendopeptidase F [Leuconostoc]|uniref:Oligopeptidase F n=2 Tax=Leuconostoc kimchii TaxID=136609 RepID=D5T2Y2_LEUKI|nr:MULTISPECIES: oligoendopeptidase F [Leuconostoc]ADG40631.1 oligoendopeptidase F,plasmid [Leuconostoc kimchii IMSNU 11154]AEJ31388.1 oligoendopeptidase F,plasmid [Leuconostoc sp. C2]QBR47088.1 oligoendopeptidase F [Leuconostoc kimchii]